MASARPARGSLNRRLTLMVVLTTGASLFLACLAFVAYDVTTLRSAMARDASTLAAVIGMGSSAALAFDDRDTAAETLAALEAADPALAGVIYDRDGGLFARWNAEGAAGVGLPGRAPRLAEHLFRDGRLELAHPIEFGGERVGTLYLLWSTAELSARTGRYVVIVLSLLALATAFGVWISSRLRHQIARPLGAMVEGAEAVAAGNLARRAPVRADGEIGVLAHAFDAMAEGLRGLVGQVRAATREVSDVAATLRDSGEAMAAEAERQKLAVDDSAQSLEVVGSSIVEVNGLAERLAENGRETSASIVEMDASIGEVASHMDRLGDTIDTTAAAANQVASNIEQVAQAVDALRRATDGTGERLEQLSLSVRQVRANAEASRALSEDSTAEANRGMQAVDATIVAMREIASHFTRLESSVGDLSEKSTAIGEIIQVIQEVAEQTTLLSLNAAIIAAQAGEHGKAFTVVADQVKSLADRTHQSARQIADLVRGVQEETRGAVTAVEQGGAVVEKGVTQSGAAGEVLRRIIEKATNTASRVEEIHVAAATQSDDLASLDEAVGGVRERVDEIHASTREQQRATAEIAAAVDEVRQLGGRVRRSTDEQRGSSRLITQAATDVAAMIDQIAEATGALTKGREDIQRALQVFRDGSEAAGRRTGDLLQGVDTLTERAAHLEQEIGRFKTE